MRRAATASSADGSPPVPAPTPTFEEIYEQHFAFVWRVLRRLGVEPAALDDATQDVFLVVHRRLAEFEARAAVTTWLFGIARRVAQDHRRRAVRKPAGAELSAEVANTAPSPLDDAMGAQAARLLHAFLDTLDDDKRAVFVLAELEQLAAPEIAAALDVNVNTVYSRLRAARQAFEKAVARQRAADRATDRAADKETKR